MIISRAFLSGFKFKPMDSVDKMGFAGVESPVPLIAENEDYLVIIDGVYCEVYDAVTIDGNFEPTETCDNICELPY
jgi:hypothetical protein